MNTPTPRRNSLRAFSLIELLVVIAIIALLSGLIAWLLPGINEKKIRARVKTEMNALEAVILQYKAKNGYYPPDNTNDPALPPLYYELKAVEPGAAEKVQLNVGGIANASGEGNIRQDFFPTMKPAACATNVVNNTPLLMLVVPYKGPTMIRGFDYRGVSGEFNTWRYNSHEPRHNLESFDLWAEVQIGNKTVIIGNWKE